MRTDILQRRLDQFTAAAKEAGLKLTHQRLEIFREIASREDHPDANGVYSALHEKMPTLSLDTVYRTLWTLHDLGLIHVIGSGSESVRFDANMGEHHHFVCVKCGLVRDFENSDLNLVAVHNDVQDFGSVLDTHIEVRGICNECQRISG